MKHIDLVFIFFISLVVIEGAANSGPYKAILLTVETCKSKAEENAQAAIVDLEIYNTTTKVNLLRGNITIISEPRVKGARLKNFIWSNNKWKGLRVVNTVACNGVFFPLVAMLFGIKYNRRNCVISKGFFSVNDLDNDKIQHAWIRNQEYGKHRWIMEVFSNNGTALCVESTSLVKPPD